MRNLPPLISDSPIENPAKELHSSSDLKWAPSELVMTPDIAEYVRETIALVKTTMVSQIKDF
jgi:hypothetical protein